MLGLSSHHGSLGFRLVLVITPVTALYRAVAVERHECVTFNPTVAG